MNMLRFTALSWFMGLTMALVSSVANAQTERPVRMVVPFPPGSATDMAARVIGAQLQVSLGQTFIIDNKPGAGGSIGAMEVVRAPADGHTLLFASNSAAASNVALLKSMPYDPLKDLSPVSGIGETALALLVKTSHPAKDLKEFIAWVKQRPGKVSAGHGSSSAQISIAMLNKGAGLDALLVPYKGIPLAVKDVVGGTLDFTFADLGNSMAQVKGGNLKALAVTSLARNPLVADWPPMADAIAGYDINAWFAVLGPANMPKPAVDKLNAAFAKVLAMAEVKDKLAGIGVVPMAMTPERLKLFLAAEVGKWQRLAKDANIQPE